MQLCEHRRDHLRIREAKDDALAASGDRRGIGRGFGADSDQSLVTRRVSVPGENAEARGAETLSEGGAQ